MSDYTLDLDTLTVGELELLEDVAGMDALDQIAAGKRSTRIVRAIYTIARRRSDSLFTAEMAKDLPVRELSNLELVKSDPNPDGGAAR